MSRNGVRIGTSGWNYEHWQPRFYPRELRQQDWLGYYQMYFSTVEINNTFYQLPKAATFQRWHEQASEDFIYTVKANRYITHMKKLKNPSDSLPKFLERARLLQENLGLILWQLPPHWHANIERLEAFIQLLPENILYVFEFRDADWFRTETKEILKEYGMIFCIHDKKGVDCPQWITANSVYLRFHGSHGNYGGLYGPSKIKVWAECIRNWRKEGRSIFAYFNNDERGYALKDARRLIQELDL
jgi:uncharacterized protein YecE (DUF72 family)